jgi:3'(2'), 5'-bisphosphate nucleotidase
MSPEISDALLEKLTAAVSRAGAAILALAAAPGARQKADLSPVTAADEASEAIILHALAEALPGIPVISEEASAAGVAPAGGGRFVLVDPLDGTREFIAGLPEYTVNVALVADGTPILGIVGAPALATVWRGVRGRGAERLRLAAGEPPDRARERVGIRTRGAPPDRLVAVISRSHLDDATTALLGRLPVAERLACGSSLKFCRLAEGTADLYPRLAPTMEWDVAAGHAILAAAGGVVIRPDGAPLRYGNSENQLRIPAFLAWGDPQAATRYLP